MNASPDALGETGVDALAPLATAAGAEVDSVTDGQVEPEPAAAQVIFGAQLDLARRYVDWLVDAGVVRGLIGPREPARIWTRHVLNCAVVANLLPDAARVVDVGSGAGLPGIPWAIARPDCFLTLVEPLERRVTFLNEVVADLGLVNVTVIRGRADEVVDQCGQADVVTSRAVAPLARLARWSTPLARHGGELLALKGASVDDEIARDLRELKKLGLADVRSAEIGQGVVAESTYIFRARIDRTAAAGKRSGKAGGRAKRPK